MVVSHKKGNFAATIRRAGIKDIDSISRLVNEYRFRSSGNGQLLPLTDKDILRVIKNRSFYVAEVNKRVIACGSIIGYNGIAELRSLAVSRRYQGKGLGTAIIKKCLQEAKKRGYNKVYALTQTESVFMKAGFEKSGVPPEKLKKYCMNCPIRDKCNETALVIKL